MDMDEGKGVGLITFESVREGLKAERLLREEGYTVKAVLPPEEYVRGCDLAVEFDLVEQLGIERVLRGNKVDYDEIVSLDTGSGVKPLDLVKTTDFGDSIMVRAGQMKITFNKNTGVIQNISGGGCPDVPYLYIRMVGMKLPEAPCPRDIGRTLCGMMLDRAFTEALEMHRKADAK